MNVYSYHTLLLYTRMFYSDQTVPLYPLTNLVPCPILISVDCQLYRVWDYLGDKNPATLVRGLS